MIKTTCTTIWVTFVILVFALPAEAAQYRVEFMQTGDGGKQVTLGHDEIDNATPWHTINDHAGVNLFNSTGELITALRIKVRDKTQDSFLVDFNSGGDLFAEVWKRKDDSEVLFLKGSFKAWSVVWNRVNDTSGSTEVTDDIFEGSLNPSDQSHDPRDWDQLAPVPSPAEERPQEWVDLQRGLPAGFAAPTVYVESAERIVVVSNGFPFVYDRGTGDLRAVLIRRPFSTNVNRLHLRDNNLELWADGVKTASTMLSTDTLSEPVPKK